MDYKESLSAVEAAELLKITKNTVYELVKRGEIPSYKVGKKLRIDKCDVEEYINCWNDLLNEDITIVNREKGSGVRILIDEKLRVNNIDNKNIKQSHFSVVTSIVRGEGNVGVGNEKVAAQVKGIDFIPIQEEKYDIVIKKCDLEKPFFKEVIALIQSKDFKSEVESLGFYDLKEIGKVTGL